jgi:hypothetical protein
MQQRYALRVQSGLVVLWLFLTIIPAWGATLYVAPNGSDQNPGTWESPLATLDAVSRLAVAGDTVIFLPGTYPGVLQPLNSGRADAPIRFKAAEPGKAVLSGSGSSFAVSIVDVSYITIEGFYFNPQEATGRWVWLQNASHITIADNLMENAIHSTMPFHVTYSEQVFIRGNVMRRLAPDRLYGEQAALGLFRVGNSHHVLFEGNTVGRTNHHLMSTDPPGSTSHIVVRGNVFHAEHSRNVVFFATNNTLFEGNIVVTSYKGARSGGSNTRFHSDGGIFRFNRFYYNWGGSLILYPDPEEQYPGPIRNLRFYHNVFDRNVDYGVSVLPRGRMQDVIFTNNIFTNNDYLDDYDQVVLTDAQPDQVLFIRNAIYNGLNEGISYGNSARTTVVESLHVDPHFAAPEKYDHALAPHSPLLDAGRFFTTTVGSGSGTQIDVEDSWYFSDGFGIEGELGDLIHVGVDRQVARIVAIDRTTNRITVDRPLQWQAGDPVSLPWAGAAPDIGVYEHGVDGRVSLKIDLSAFPVLPGEPVTLRPVWYGSVDPVSYHWMLGDGTAIEAETVLYAYQKAGQYPLLLKAVDSTGHTYYATALIVVETPRAPEAPLLHTTFDADDVRWWQDWRTDYPLPSVWERVLDQTTGEGYMQIDAPTGYSEPAGTLHALARPANWRIDDYPYVFIRYSILPGTPIALYLDGFENRSVYVASTLAHEDKSTAGVNRITLIDDGRWHELVVDVRSIRQRYPEVMGLEGVGFRTGGRLGRVGQGYRLDEVAILPANYDFGPRVELAAQVMSAEKAQVGVIPIALQAKVPDDDGIHQVELEFAGASVYQGAVIPERFVLDTDQTADGAHLLVFTVTTRQGLQEKLAIPVVVKNTWTLADQFMPPIISPFLGSVDFTLTSEESSGWRIDTTRPERFYYDEHRKVRINDTREYLMWRTPALLDVTVSLYAAIPAGERFVALDVWTAEGTWVPIAFTVQSREERHVGLQQVTLVGQVPDGVMAEALRLTLLPTGASPDALQIGAVELRGWGVLEE